MALSWYKSNINIIKYGLIIINIFLMISAIRAIVNHQTIRTSIDEIKIQVEDTQEHTDYINNFVAPYLKSEYAPYFFAHENNQIFVEEKIINIIYISDDFSTMSGQLPDSPPQHTLLGSGQKTTTAPQERNRYLSEIVSSLSR